MIGYNELFRVLLYYYCCYFCNLNNDYGKKSESVSLQQLCPTLCDPMDSSLPGFSVQGILHVRILE